MNETRQRIAVLGAGSWGMALARLLSMKGHRVEVWTKHAEKLRQYDRERVYPPLSDMPIPAGIIFTGDLSAAVSGQDALVFAVPSTYMRETAAAAAPHAEENLITVSVSKGIEPHTHLTMSEVIADEFSKCAKKPRLVVLSGPTHAEEVARDLPTTIVSASGDTEAAGIVQDMFMSPSFRVYTNTDTRAVELMGAMKNIFAIAAGISEGLGYGDNAKAAIITRGLREMTRLGEAMGLDTDTFYGLSGVGDLIVTSTSMNSRNNRAGILLGRGFTPDEAGEKIGMVVEGFNALPAVTELSAAYEVDMPILAAVDSVVRRGADPKGAVNSLMMRDKKDELW